MLNLRLPYTLFLLLLLPIIFLRLIWRARKQPEYLNHIGERFGFYPVHCDKPVLSPSTSSGQAPRSGVEGPVIWLHAVSVGETRATQSLVTRLRATYPHHQILLTHTTPTGRAAGEQLYGESVLRAYLPYDYPFAVNKFLRHFRPQLGILMETEIWFNLIHACHEAGTPLLLLNARMSEKSARGYARFSRLTRSALNELAATAAQTTDDAARLNELGALNVTVMGNLKFDIEPPAAMLELGKQLREQFGVTRKVFIAASTRDGEESILLDALRNIQIPELLIVIVPRHPQRFSEVAGLLEQRGIKFQRRSSNRTVASDTQVVLGDSMGELFAYYAAADLAFIGGSLLPYGGQNLIESCAVGTPVLVGPHTENFSEATQLAVNAGAALQVRNATEIMAEMQHLLENPKALQQMRFKCSRFVELNRGATDKALRVIKSLQAITWERQ